MLEIQFLLHNRCHKLEESKSFESSQQSSSLQSDLEPMNPQVNINNTFTIQPSCPSAGRLCLLTMQEKSP